MGSFVFYNIRYNIEKSNTITLTDGLYADLDKIPQNAIIRTKQNGDVFTKFGGGTKKLNDFLTDKKIPLRLRDAIPCIAVDNNILVIFGVALSDNVKICNTTKTIIKFTQEGEN